ncbi:phage shock protein A [Bacterioplanes sanyensis]|uniref:PspA/IM30 family protein n=1 Tax=Bacterioplanes sanyensis TaxID=1249553 RepID=UPI001672EAEB|nr:PspA/IM30 family protein [Bacterioplanes sanyensis]GGY50882.1 phage shock protein A [Bacterioplanes sanyensis]
MSLSKIWTALKGSFNETTESIADSQSLRILDQEIREAKKELQAGDQSLTKIMAKRKLAENKAQALQADIDTYSNHAVAAMEQGNEELALECAEKVSELETQLAQEQEILSSFLQSESTLKANMAKAKANVRRMEQQVDQIKATESVQKAQVAVSSRHVGANNKVKTALDSLERIKGKQAQRAAELEAAEEMANAESGSDLDAKLRSAGVIGGGTSGKDKLAQLMASRGNK